MDKVEQFVQLVQNSNNIVFFGGAGVSTESGIPDFRSVDGLYSQKYKYPPERILSHSFFKFQTEDFFDFYREKMLFTGISPNITHIKLAKLESLGKLKAIVTQNIDGLHQLAGSKNVLELHGSVLRNYCQRCHKAFSSDFIKNGTGVPKCDCGGVIKPDVVLYEEALSGDIMDKALSVIEDADVLIVGGTSLSVYPAAGLLNYYRGNKLILINKGATSSDAIANLCISEGLGKVFGELNI